MNYVQTLEKSHRQTMNLLRELTLKQTVEEVVCGLKIFRKLVLSIYIHIKMRHGERDPEYKPQAIKAVDDDVIQ